MWQSGEKIRQSASRRAPQIIQQIPVINLAGIWYEVRQLVAV